MTEVGTKFVDRWGNIWEFALVWGKPMVWNRKSGNGVWDNGKGLTKIQ